MQEIIAPIDYHLIEEELMAGDLLCRTRFENRMVFVTDAHVAPNTMQEIGRLREISFREAGGGTGKPTDIDEYDTMDEPYKQLIVWDFLKKKIIGGYRFIEGDKVKILEDGSPRLSTSEIFNFSEKFIRDYLPYTIELGRSFICPEFQASRLGIFSLDNLWDGLGGLVRNHPNIQYFFGKMTMYTNFNKEARDQLLYFLKRFCPDKEKLVCPREPLQWVTPEEKLQEALKDCVFIEDGFKTTVRKMKELGENIPPLFSSYLKLSPTIKCFGTAVNPHFGNVEETGILIKIMDIYKEKLDRYVQQL